MAYNNRIDIVRKNIYIDVKMYQNVLAGKYFMYVFNNECFEMYFGIDNFLHLTGVGTKLSANQFYKLAKKKQLQNNQMYFDNRYSLSSAIKKTSMLHQLRDFVCNSFYIVKNFKTNTEFYPYTITNVDLSLLLGLKTEESATIYIPKSLRVKDNTFIKNSSKNIYQIQAIFSKTDKLGAYDTILYQEKNILKTFPTDILNKIDSQLIINANI